MLLGQLNFLLVLSGDCIGFLGAVELNMAVGGKVWGDSTVGSVGSSSTSDGSLSGNVGNGALLNIETLGLSVRLEVGEEVQDVFDGLFWESTVVMLILLAHGLSAWATGESSEWDDVFVGENSVHVFNGLKDVHSSASSSSLIGVLEVSSQVVDLGGGGYNTAKKLIRSTVATVKKGRIGVNFHTVILDMPNLTENILESRIYVHLVGSAGFLEYLTIGILYF